MVCLAGFYAYVMIDMLCFWVCLAWYDLITGWCGACVYLSVWIVLVFGAVTFWLVMMQLSLWFVIWSWVLTL